jgi:polar amino acid transport system permease protein
LVPRMPRWDRVKKSFFDWERLVDSFPRLLEAFILDIKIFAWTTPAILIVAILIAIARSTRNPALFPVRIFVIAYTDIMRGVPVILWIYLVGFGVPGIGLDRPWNSPLIWGSVALGMTYSAYVAEVFRAGIESVHESQRAAARSLGLSSAQTMRHVILPQAIRRVVPPLMNDMVSLQKDVALVSLIGPIEILRQAGIDKAKFATSPRSLALHSSSLPSLFRSPALPTTYSLANAIARELPKSDEQQTQSQRSVKVIWHQPSAQRCFACNQCRRSHFVHWCQRFGKNHSASLH